MGIAAIAQGSRITGQRHCYNLCESRAGLASLIVAARGYAFWVGLSVARGEVGGHRVCRFDNPTIAAEESGAYGGRRQSRWRPLRPAALLSELRVWRGRIKIAWAGNEREAKNSQCHDRNRTKNFGDIAASLVRR
jgi:hypothetical protein